MLGTGEFNAGGTLGWPSIPSSEKIGIFLVALCYSDNLHSDISTLSTSLVLGVGVTSIYGGDLLIARYQIGKCSVCLTVAHNTNISMAKLVNAGMVSSCKLVQDNTLVILSNKFCPCLVYVTLPLPPHPLVSLLSPPPSVWASRISFQNNIEPVFQNFIHWVGR